MYIIFDRRWYIRCFVLPLWFMNIVNSNLQECYDFCEKLSEEHLRDLTETLFVPTSNQHLLKKVVFSKPWNDIIFRNFVISILFMWNSYRFLFYFIFFLEGGPRRLDFTVFVRFRWLLRRVICEVLIYLIFQIHVPNKANITSQHITSDLNRLRTSANTHIFPVVEQVRDWRTYCMLFVCLFAF